MSRYAQTAGLRIRYSSLLQLSDTKIQVHILCVGDAVMAEAFRGQIRKEDVRAVEKDRVEMYRSFRWTNLNCCHNFVFSLLHIYTPTNTAAWYLSNLRPGDIALARVISLGDAGARPTHTKLT